jgi:hypothetical protein
MQELVPSFLSFCPFFLGGAAGIFFMILGIVMFIPGFYYTRTAYYARSKYNRRLNAEVEEREEKWASRLRHRNQKKTS